MGNVFKEAVTSHRYSLCVSLIIKTWLKPTVTWRETNQKTRLKKQQQN